MKKYTSILILLVACAFAVTLFDSAMAEEKACVKDAQGKCVPAPAGTKCCDGKQTTCKASSDAKTTNATSKTTKASAKQCSGKNCGPCKPGEKCEGKVCKPGEKCEGKVCKPGEKCEGKVCKPGDKCEGKTCKPGECSTKAPAPETKKTEI